MSEAADHIIRTPDQRLRVFVSSTLQEVADERQAAREAIEQLHLAPVMFELGARPHPPKDLYRAYLDQSDIFVGIYWQRYGWVAPDMDISGLEDEWRLSGDKPKLIYIKAPAPEREPRLKELIDSIRGDDHVSYKPFTRADELHDLIENDLALLLTERFAKIRAVEAVKPQPTIKPHHNLPNQLTSFIGRTKEVTEVKRLIAAQRLITLVGPGGTGKSRLSLQVATHQVDRFKDGVWLVELAPIANPAFIESTIAVVFDVREAQGVPLINLLIDYLRAKELLLILDNCEHLVEASAQIADQLLHACPKLKIVVSSREALGIDGETVYRVPSLSLPDRASSDLMAYEATRLFIERATKAEPRFHATADAKRAAAIIQICQRLDGIPLAIELAAARVKLFTPEQIAERLDDRFKLLTGGSRTALPRQQTLRAMIDWSYQSLTDLEQRALRRLAVFLGGWTIEAAEAVIGEDEALDGLMGLVNKSLVNVEEQSGAARYRFLETIRQYAMEKLLESGEAVESRNRQLDYVLKLVGDAEPEGFGSLRLPWLDQMEVEHDNLRAALDWSSSNDLAKAIQLAEALGYFWTSRDYNAEAVAWCQTILTRSETFMTLAAPRAKLYGVLAQAAINSGNHKLARTAANVGLSLATQAADNEVLVRLNSFAGLASMFLADFPAAQHYLHDAEALAREIGLTGELVIILVFSGETWLSAGGDVTQAKACLAEAESLTIAGGIQWGIPAVLFGFAQLSGMVGDIEKARTLYKQTADAARKLGSLRMVYSCHSELAHILRQRGEIDEALALYKQALPRWEELGQRAAVAHELECMAFIHAQKDQLDRAVTLLGAAEALRDLIDSAMTPLERAEYDQALSKLHTQLDENTFKQLWVAGRAMTMEQAIQLALT